MSKHMVEDILNLALLFLFFWGSVQVVVHWGWLLWTVLMVGLYVLLSLWKGWRHGATH